MGDICISQSTERVVPQAVLDRPATVEQYVREALNLPPEWKWCVWSAEGYPETWGQTIEGGIAPPKERGKYKGQPDWKRATMMRKMTVPDTALDAWIASWENATGYCHKCEGTGQRWAGWNCETGTRYKPCKRCDATGFASATPSIGTGEAEAQPTRANKNPIKPEAKQHG